MKKYDYNDRPFAYVDGFQRSPAQRRKARIENGFATILIPIMWASVLAYPILLIRLWISLN